MSSQSIIKNIIHLNTRSGTPLATTVYCSGTGEHAIRKGTWQGGKVGVRVNEVEVSKDP
jgi:hypothetical protein